jgi:hypothetical protein
MDFVKEQKQVIDSIFPGKNFAEEYMRNVLYFIDCTREPEK